MVTQRKLESTIVIACIAAAVTVGIGALAIAEPPQLTVSGSTSATLPWPGEVPEDEFGMGLDDRGPVWLASDGIFDVLWETEGFGGLSTHGPTRTIAFWAKSSTWSPEVKKQMFDILEYAKSAGVTVVINEVMYTHRELRPLFKTITKAAAKQGFAVRLEDEGGNQVNIRLSARDGDETAFREVRRIATSVLGPNITVTVNGQ